jgi:ubiquinone/menaquinone biosynthesis C-methylase UbiE
VQQVTTRQAHWDEVYGRLKPEECSWHEAEPTVSLQLIARASPQPGGRIIDVGGGASRLVDHLCGAGWSGISVLDIAARSLREASARLGDRAGQVQWIVGDVLDVAIEPETYDVWHDRAVFHFLTQAADRARYMEQLTRALKPGGHVVLGTFDATGPEQCSRLTVARYSPPALFTELGPGFEMVAEQQHVHVTPTGRPQNFAYVLARRRER